MEYKNCPNCNKKLHGLLTSGFILQEGQKDFINKYFKDKKEAYCNTCGGELINKAANEVARNKKDLEDKIGQKLHLIPIVTTHTPQNWSYQIIGIVSAQSVTGTGFSTELSSSWADFLGVQSSALGNKISGGEDLCCKQIRFKTLLKGGNAIIATDIDYSEVGAGRGMMMVCIAGTAVKTISWNLADPEAESEIDMVMKLAADYNKWNVIVIPEIE